jgi:hypothetical protein
MQTNNIIFRITKKNHQDKIEIGLNLKAVLKRKSKTKLAKLT